MRTMKNSLLLLLPALFFAAPAADAQNTEIVYDSFEYPAGPIGGLSGGKGWTGTWWSGATADGALVEMPGMDAVGGMLVTNIEHEGSYRVIDMAPLGPIVDGGTLGKDDTTVWIRFTMMREAGGDDFYGGMVLNWQWNSEQLFIGSPWGSDELGIEKPWVTGVTSIPGTSIDIENTIVTRIDFLAGDDRVQVWANPGTDFPTTVADIDQLMPDIKFNEIKFSSGSGFLTGVQFDNFHIDTPAFAPVYNIANLVAGSTATLTVTGAAAGATVVMAYSLTGAGPTPTVYGDVDMSLPINQLSPVVADATGTAALSKFIPVAALGRTIYSQAVELIAGGGGLLSNSLIEVVQ
jgi:hypothetical protein